MGTGVVIDYVRGEALLGQTAVAVADAGTRGQLRLGGPEGPILRPLTFGERTRTVARAIASSRPGENVCVGILLMATVRPGVAERIVQEILALALAGAGQAAPPFAEAALMVARSTGWEHAELEDAEAAEIDRLAIHLGGRQSDPQWNRLLLAKEPAGELETLRAELADDLLERANTALHHNSGSYKRSSSSIPNKSPHLVFDCSVGARPANTLPGTPENLHAPIGAFERFADDPGPSRSWNAGATSSPDDHVGAVLPSPGPWTSYGEIEPAAEGPRPSPPSEPAARPLGERVRYSLRYGHHRPDPVPGKIDLSRLPERTLEGSSIPAKAEPASSEQAATPPGPTWRVRLNNAGAPATAPLADPPSSILEGAGPPSSTPEGTQLSSHSTSTALDGSVTIPPPPAIPDGDVPWVGSRLEVEPPGITTQPNGAPSGLWGSSEELPSVGGDDTLTGFADVLATLLHDEADMRGIAR